MERRVYRFGDFEVDEQLLELRRGGRPVEIQPKAFFLVLHLIRHRDRLVPRDELVSVVWPDAAVSGASLSTALHEARRALDDTASGRGLIVTQRRRGYRFVGEVEEIGAATADPRDESERSAAGGRTEPAPDPTNPFVDREPEMEQLRAALVAASAGARRVVLLHGPPGIGKTRTANELAIDAARGGFEVHVGRTHEGDGAPPFWPWIQVLRSIGEARPASDLRLAAGLAAADLVQLVPELRATLGDPVERTELAPEQARFRMFDGVTGFIRSVARARPLLLLFDDLHWADDASLALLVFLTRGLTEASLAIVGTHRPLTGVDPARERRLGRVLREPGTASMALAGLRPASVERILRQMLGRPVPAHVLERVGSITGGNPFFVAELSRLLAARGSNAWVDTRRWPIPDRLRDTVRIRIADCSALCQSVLRAGSVIGPRFTLPLLRQAIEPRSARELVEALAEAEHADFVYRDQAPGAYRFAHGLVRETLYEELPPAERKHLHRVIGDALEKLSASDPTPRLAELAHHFTEAAELDRAERAIDYARRAAARARAVFAHQEQADNCQRALDVLQFLDPPDPVLRCELLVDLVEALEAAHATLESVEKTAEEAIELARKLERPELLARAAQVRGRYTLDKDTLAFLDTARVGPLLQRLLPPIEESLGALGEAHADLRVWSLLLLTRIHATMGDMPRATALVEQADASAKDNADLAQRCAILGARFEVTSGLERPAESRAIADGIVDYGRRARRPEMEVYGHVGRASLCLQACDRDGADAAGADIEQLAREHALGDLLILAALWRALEAQLEGHFDDAEREIQGSVQLSRRFNLLPERATAIATLQYWWLSLLRGRPMTLLPQLSSYTSAQPSVLFARFLLARLHAELGRRQDVQSEPRLLDASALDRLPRDHTWLFSACLSAEICALIGDTERGRAIFALLRPYAELAATGAFIGTCIGSSARSLGALAATLEMWSESEDLFDQALASNEALRAPPLIVWTQIDYARVLLRHPRPRQRTRGERMLERAAQAAVPLGMSAALSRARRVS